jgi:hypothetical protein
MILTFSNIRDMSEAVTELLPSEERRWQVEDGLPVLLSPGAPRRRQFAFSG